jgi:hypothetical protein
MIQVPAITFDHGVPHRVMHSNPARRRTVMARAAVGRSLTRFVDGRG